ncbi:MAG: thioredoxin domain-containing protein [Chloroflexi bacterium]|nr:thioredoxin domain-containing protein [Chloroflexota bacterium]
MKRDYVDTGDVRLVYRHFAFLGEESVWAAEASECAAEQGKFWEYHDILYENWVGTNVGAYAYNNLIGFADILQLDVGQFGTCMDERKYLDRVRGDSEFAEDNGVTSTPTVFINGQHVRGNDYGTFRDAIEAALAGN